MVCQWSLRTVACAASVCGCAAASLTNPTAAVIGYSFGYVPALKGLVMAGGWGEPEWTPRTNVWLLTAPGWKAASPGPAMVYHSSALDTHRNVLVVCGRTNYPSKCVNVMYEFDGKAWASKPGFVAGVDGDVELAYDSARRRLVACVADSVNSETWEYDGVNWVKQSTKTHPTAVNTGMLTAFDPLSNVVVLVTITNKPDPSEPLWSETWTYDGTDWSIRAAGMPTNALMGGMAWDAARSNIVLLTTTSETWTWNGAAWSRKTPAQPPDPPRWAFTMAYDPLREVSAFFSGELKTDCCTQVYPIDTWEWNGSDWRKGTPEPCALFALSLAAVIAVRRSAHNP